MATILPGARLVPREYWRAVGTLSIISREREAVVTLDQGGSTRVAVGDLRLLGDFTVAPRKPNGCGSFATAGFVEISIT
jgi:hypothetical protein